MVKVTSSPFGGQTRTRVLLALRLLGDTYARELSRLLETSLSGVQKALRSLEMDGLVAGRSVGRTRVYQLNPRYFAADALAAYLARVAEPESRLREPSAIGEPVIGIQRVVAEILEHRPSEIVCTRPGGDLHLRAGCASKFGCKS